MDLCKVLLADDEKIILEGYQKLFDWEKHGCRIVGTAMDGKELIDHAKELQPDVIVFDINMPRMNGLDSIKIITEKSFMSHPVYTIAVSGYDEFAYCQQALRLKVSDYLLKPIDFQALGNSIDSIVRTIFPRDDQKRMYSPVMDRIIKWIDEHLSDEVSLTLLAEQFNFNASYISQLFKKEMGVGYHDYLQGLRIKKAQEYLAKSNDSILDISQKVGFRDYRVFSKTFKLVIGETPTHYRQNQQKNKPMKER